ncbi:MAG: hypothetical protein PUF63_02445 [Prevotella sp.]|nr:hypothetical protein [Prevotella sp.]
MDSKDIRRHCPEVDNLMKGRMPFVTRYGITIVVLAITVIVVSLLLSGGASQQLMKGMIEHTIEQIKSKI